MSTALMRRFLCALGMLLVSVVGPGQPALAGSEQLELLDAALQPVKQTRLVVAGGATSVSRTFFLRASEDHPDPIKDVRLSLELSAGTASFNGPGGAALPAPVVVPAHRGVFHFELTVSVPAGGSSTGTIVAVVGDHAQGLAEVVTSAEAKPAVAIAENADGITRTATTTDYTLFLTLTAGAAGAKQVSAVVPQLTDTRGVQVPVTVTINGQSGPVTMEPLATMRLSITAQLGQPGDHTGSILISHDGAREPGVRLTITRTQVKPSVEVVAIQRIEGTTRDPVVLEAYLHETSGQGVQLDTPQLIPTGRKEGEARVGPTFKTGQVRVERIDPQSGKASPVEAGLNLGGSESVTIRFTVEGLEDPGEYGVKLVLAAPSATSLTTDATILRKSPWGLAMLALLLGAGFVFLIRYYLKPRRDAAPQRVDYNNLRADFDALQSRQSALDTDASSIFSVITAELVELRDAANGTDTPGFTAKRDRLNVKLTLVDGWLLARRRIEALRTSTGKPLLVGQLASLLPKLLSRTAPKTDLDGALALTVQLSTAIDTVLRSEVEERVAVLRAEVEAAAQQGSYLWSQAARQVLTEKVMPELTTAQTVLSTTDDVALKAFDALSHLEEARKEFAAALVQDLGVRVSEPAPPSISDDDWSALRGQVQAALSEARDNDTDSVLDAYNHAFAIFLSRLAAVAEVLATQACSTFDAAHPNPNAQQQAVLGHYRKAIAAAGSVAPFVQQGKRSEAFVAYTQALTETEAAAAAATGPGPALAPGPAAPKPPPPPPKGGPGPWLASSAAAGAPSPRDARSFNDPVRAGKLAEWLAFCISAAAATILGLSVLWAKNPTWGGLADFAVAFGWGAGLHEVAGQAVTGVGGVLKKAESP